MYRLTVRDRVMIAHSFQGEVFGPAQGVHGATYVVETEFQSKTLDEHNLVVDIGLAHDALHRVLAVLNYQHRPLAKPQAQDCPAKELDRPLWRAR